MLTKIDANCVGKAIGNVIVDPVDPPVPPHCIISPLGSVVYPLGVLDTAMACETQFVPSEVNRLPAVPGATVLTAEVPLPISTALAGIVATPVPPAVTGSVPVVRADVELA
jgi:hypothetical protein